MPTIKFLCSASPRFKFEEEYFETKPGFNEMPGKFTKDPYYEMCKKDGIVKDFVSSPTDRQQEDFDVQIQAERERADKAEKELEKLKAQSKSTKR